MSTELTNAIERAANELEALGHLLKAISDSDSIDQAQALAWIGEERAGMSASWLRDVISSERMMAGARKK
jgi:hypothetical protein